MHWRDVRGHFQFYSHTPAGIWIHPSAGDWLIIVRIGTSDLVSCWRWSTLSIIRWQCSRVSFKSLPCLNLGKRFIETLSFLLLYIFESLLSEIVRSQIGTFQYSKLTSSFEITFDFRWSSDAELHSSRLISCFCSGWQQSNLFFVFFKHIVAPRLLHRLCRLNFSLNSIQAPYWCLNVVSVLFVQCLDF